MNTELLTIFVEDTEVHDIPKKESGYTLSKKSSCNNGVTISWDVITWTSKINYSNYVNTGERTKCNLYFERDFYRELILNGTDPVLRDELVPVIIDNDGVTHQADFYKEWYNYENKLWANAVILKDKSIIYQNEEIIPEDNIESYFVWIPRYKYQIFNDINYDLSGDLTESKVQRIAIEFERKDIVSSNGHKNGEWLTHPAFTSFNSNGFWVGKFETSKSNTNPDNSINPEGVQIKPNETAWRNAQIANAFYTSYEYKRNLDSHMMKNMEWGAVAYFAHSKFGIEDKIRFNNNSAHKTGYASVLSPTCGNTEDNRDCNRYGTTNDITLPYNTETGYLASTTGNITGIYDMAGGSWDVVMGVMKDSNGNLVSGRNNSYNSGFVGVFTDPSSGSNPSKLSLTKEEGGLEWPLEKYYDLYNYGDSFSDFQRGYFGDATKELGPFGKVSYISESSYKYQISSWYNEWAYFMYHENPWIMRGTEYSRGINAGIFAFSGMFGNGGDNTAFRVILTP